MATDQSDLISGRFTPDEGNKSYYSIALKVYECPDPDDPRRLVKLTKEIDRTGNYSPVRSATLSIGLPVGKYVLIASTFRAGQECKLTVEASAVWPVVLTHLTE